MTALQYSEDKDQGVIVKPLKQYRELREADSPSQKTNVVLKPHVAIFHDLWLAPRSMALVYVSFLKICLLWQIFINTQIQVILQ